MVGGRHREFGQPDRSGHDCARTGDRMRASIGPIPKWGHPLADVVHWRRIERREPGGPARPYSAVKSGGSGCPRSIPLRGQKGRRFRKRPPRARSRRAGSIHSGSAP